MVLSAPDPIIGSQCVPTSRLSSFRVAHRCAVPCCQYSPSGHTATGLRDNLPVPTSVRRTSFCDHGSPMRRIWLAEMEPSMNDCT